MKGKTKTQKGITLVALIITIVVLLILAAVAISSIKNDGIIGHATNSTGAYNQSVVNEQDVLGGYDNVLNKYQGGKIEENDDTTEEVPSIQLDKTEITKTTTLTATLTNLNESNLVWTTSNESVVEVEGTGTTVNVVTKSLGDAIITATCGSYSVTCNVTAKAIGREGQTVQYDSNSDGDKEDWIVLTDRNGLVEIVSADAMGNLTLGGLEDYNNLIEIINNYCKSLVTATDNEGVRSVGASEDTSGNFSTDSTNSKDIYWFKKNPVKAGDQFHKTDAERMKDLGILCANTDYYFASRTIAEANDILSDFQVRYVYGANGEIYSTSVCYYYSEEIYIDACPSKAVRPVIINPSGI